MYEGGLLSADGRGWQQLRSLMLARPGYLGFIDPVFCMPGGGEYFIHETLGCGASASVWRVTPTASPETPYACKRYSDSGFAAFLKDRDMMTLFQAKAIARVPRIVAASDCAPVGAVLIVEPIGTRIRELTRVCFLDLLDTLEAVHRVGVVNRDIRLANIMCHGDSILLIDWNCAVCSRDAVHHSGTLRNASNTVLAAVAGGSMYVPTPQDDLIAVVRLLAQQVDL